MRKKYSVLLGTMAVTAAVLLTACGGEKENGNQDAQPTTAPTTSAEQNPGTSSGDLKNEAKGYLFEYNGVTVGMDMEAAPIIEALGEPSSYFEAPSCAFEGLDKMYTYGSFEIDTYELNGKDYISAVLLKDDMIATPEGVSLFMKKADMVKAYGENYTEEFGMLVYEKDGMKLKFIVTDDEITSIEYATTALDAQ